MNWDIHIVGEPIKCCRLQTAYFGGVRKFTLQHEILGLFCYEENNWFEAAFMALSMCLELRMENVVSCSFLMVT